MRRETTVLAAYVANGLIATAVHFCVLWTNINLLKMSSAGGANLLAAIVGIGASFIGNRWFVFRASEQPILQQAMRYLTLYVAIALMHGCVLWIWTDVSGLDYRLGFVIATTLQFALSFVGNRYLVFRQTT
ncbi:MAG: GtrA family protein [Chitinophagaceae bacterium]